MCSQVLLAPSRLFDGEAYFGDHKVKCVASPSLTPPRHPAGEGPAEEAKKKAKKAKKTDAEQKGGAVDVSRKIADIDIETAAAHGPPYLRAAAAHSPPKAKKKTEREPGAEGSNPTPGVPAGVGDMS